MFLHISSFSCNSHQHYLRWENFSSIFSCIILLILARWRWEASRSISNCEERISSWWSTPITSSITNQASHTGYVFPLFNNNEYRHIVTNTPAITAMKILISASASTYSDFRVWASSNLIIYFAAISSLFRLLRNIIMSSVDIDAERTISTEIVATIRLPMSFFSANISILY